MNFYDLVEKVKGFEGFRATAYKCPAGVVTIGYGRTQNVKMGDTTTQEVESLWLMRDLRTRYNQVCAKLDKWGYNMSESQKLALTDFAFNLGVAKLDTLTKNGERSAEEIADAILLYNKGGGRILSGLVKRREWEHSIFVGGGVIDGKIAVLQVQKLCNHLTKNSALTPLIEDNIMGSKTLERVYTCLSKGVKDTCILNSL